MPAGSGMFDPDIAEVGAWVRTVCALFVYAVPTPGTFAMMGYDTHISHILPSGRLPDSATVLL